MLAYITDRGVIQVPDGFTLESFLQASGWTGPLPTVYEPSTGDVVQTPEGPALTDITPLLRNDLIFGNGAPRMVEVTPFTEVGPAYPGAVFGEAPGTILFPDTGETRVLPPLPVKISMNFVPYILVGSAALVFLKWMTDPARRRAAV